MCLISDLIGRSDQFPCCPGKKAGAEDKKGREKPSQFSPLCFRKERRGQRDTRAETAEARIGKRGVTTFFGEANVFCPGMGPFGHRESSLFAENAENTCFSERNPHFLSAELEMITIFSGFKAFLSWIVLSAVSLSFPFFFPVEIFSLQRSLGGKVGRRAGSRPRLRPRWRG
ncbi:MAG: hypothetical protein H6Q43_1480 [Deltaproteobacteria bacterium]|nr:hypothetical protein [Deltaproteobacteria bacterium]